MKTYQRRWINEKNKAEKPAIKAFLTKLGITGDSKVAAVEEFLHGITNVATTDNTIKPMVTAAIKTNDFTKLLTKAKTKAAAPGAGAAPVAPAAPVAGAAPVAPATPVAEAFSIKEEANKRNSSFIKYLFEGSSVKKEEEPEEKEETEKEEPKEERPKKVEAPKEKKKEKEGSAVSNLLDSLDEVPATEWKRITTADEAFEVIVRGVMKKFTGITYAERQQLKVKFISAFRSVKPDA